MLRPHENPDAFKAGVMAIGVHAILLGALLFSFNWKAAHHVVEVSDVELWDKLPSAQSAVQDKPKPQPVLKETPRPVVKVQDKPVVEKKAMIEEKLKPDEPKVDIELENKKKALAEKVKLDQIKREKDEVAKKLVDQKLAEQKLAQQMREEDLQEKSPEKSPEKQKAEQHKNDALQKIKQDMLNETGQDDKRASSAANANVIGEYTDKIKAKIRNNVNKTLCGDSNPEIRFSISVLPTGQLNGTPKITKSSGIDACDEALERAIMASEPLPLPDDAELKSKFRNLNLKFRPND